MARAAAAPAKAKAKAKAKTPAQPGAPSASDATIPALAGLTDEQKHAKLTDLISRSQRGDTKAWAALQPILAKIPNWETGYVSPLEHARSALIEAATGGNVFVREAWDRRTRSLTSELAGADPSPLERILCERVALCWLGMSLAEAVYAAQTKGSIGLAAGEYYDKLRDRAHKRYLTACVALAKVRRLLAPVAQQINIAQPGAAQLNVSAPAQPMQPAPASLPATVEAAAS